MRVTQQSFIPNRTSHFDLDALPVIYDQTTVAPSSAAAATPAADMLLTGLSPFSSSQLRLRPSA
jgi:hypothetical protein